MVITPINNIAGSCRHYFLSLVCLALCACSQPPAEEQNASVKLKIDQPPAPDIIDTQDGLPDNIFDDRLEAPGLTASEFTSLYAQALQSALPQARIKITGVLSVTAASDIVSDHPSTIDLKKIWAACKDKPGARESIVRPHIQAFYGLANFVTKPLAGEEDVDKIVPMIRGRSFFANLAKTNPASLKDIYYDNYMDNLSIVYVVDDPQKIHVLDKYFLQTFAPVKRENLLELSKKNLQRISAHNITLRQDGPIFIVTAGGNYEPALILLDTVVQNLQSKVKGRLVVAIPTHNSLFICGDETEGALQKLKEMTDRALARTRLPVSKKLYVRNQGHWEIFQAFTD